jgi:hypothetical protein
VQQFNATYLPRGDSYGDLSLVTVSIKRQSLYKRRTCITAICVKLPFMGGHKPGPAENTTRSSEKWDQAGEEGENCSFKSQSAVYLSWEFMEHLLFVDHIGGLIRKGCQAGAGMGPPIFFFQTGTFYTGTAGPANLTRKRFGVQDPGGPWSGPQKGWYH